MWTPAPGRCVAAGLLAVAVLPLSCSPAPRRLSATPAAMVAEPAEQLAGALGRLYVYGTTGKAEPLEIRELRVRVSVQGPVAATEIEQTFFNPTDQRAEGTFYFPLPAGASISRLAMYVDGRLMEGELVERLRARQVYEEIVLRMRDPALMEWQEGNVFKTRVFPIPPRGPKRILIGYTQVLPMAGGERCYVYPLVSKATQASRIGRFELEATLSPVAQGAAVSVPDWPDAEVAYQGDAAQVRLSRTHFAPTRDLALRFTPKRTGSLELFTDRRAGEDGFFLLSFVWNADSSPSPPARSAGFSPSPTRPEGRTTNPEGRDWVLMVDTSLSRRADMHRAQLAAARLLLEQLGPADRFAVMTFDVEPKLHHGRLVSGRPAIEEALEALKGVTPLGGTNLAAAFAALDAFLATASARGPAEVVLLSDGIATLGESEPAKLLAQAKKTLELRRVRLHALAFGSEVDRLVLQELAVEKGGLFRSVVPGEEVEREVLRFAQAVRAPYLPNPKVSLPDGTYDIHPERLGTLIGGEELIVLGRYKQAGRAAVRLDWAEAEFDFPETDSRHVFVPRLWARERLDALLRQPQTPEVRSQAIALSQEFTLITPYTSFLVLETENDYKRYGIDRRVRRRYWEEAGKLRTAPPREELRLFAPESPSDDGDSDDRRLAERHAEMRKEGKLRQFSLADLDLSLLGSRYLNGREVATALASATRLLCEAAERKEQARDSEEERLTGEPAFWRSLTDEFFGEGRSLADEAARRLAGGERGQAQFADAIDPSAPLARVRQEFFGGDAEGDAEGQPPASAAERFAAALDAARDAARERSQALASDAGYSSSGGGGVQMAQEFFGGDEADDDRLERMARRANRDFMVYFRNGRVALEAPKAEGDWGTDALQWLHERHRSGLAAGSTHEAAALALLAFLGERDPESIGKDGILDLVPCLLERQGANGQVGDGPCGHALSTYALCEASRFVKAARLRQAAEAAVSRLLQLNVCSDTLAAAWAALALKSAERAKLVVPPAALESLKAYLERVTGDDGAVRAGGKVDLLATAAAMAARAALWGKDDAKALAAARLLLRALAEAPHLPPDGLYTLYLTTLGMEKLGGATWLAWRNWAGEHLYRIQRSSGDDAGTWDPEGIWTRGRRPVPALWLSSKDSRSAIEAALARVGAEPRFRPAYEELAAALATTSDIALLRRMRHRAAAVSRDAAALVDFRIGMLHLEGARYDDAGAHFHLAYEAAGRPDNVLAFQVAVLRFAGREAEAQDALLAEPGKGRVAQWRHRLLAALLFDPAMRAPDPAAFVRERLKGSSAASAPVLFQLAELASQAGRRDAAAAFLKQAYHGTGRLALLVEPYITGLFAAQAYQEAASELEAVIQSGYHTEWAFEQLAEAYRKLGRDKSPAYLRALTSHVEVFPRDTSPRVALAEAYESLDRPDDGVAQLLDAIRMCPEGRDLYGHLISLALRLRRFDLALDTFKKAEGQGLREDQLYLPGESYLRGLLEGQGERVAPELARRLRRAFPKDLAVELRWDTALTDLDLDVTEPGGAACNYGHKQTPSGGVLDRDDIDGHGPETYTIPTAQPGKYRIDVVYHRGDLPTTATVRIYRNCGRDTERVETHAAALARSGQRLTIATVDLSPPR